jgi:digeranylgeranylglycerophospholipid reductase
LRNWLNTLISEGKIPNSGYQIKYGGIPLKPLTETAVGRTLVVGDAAGQVKPSTGGGIYFGLLCADIAVNAIDKALKNTGHLTEHISQYDRLWRKKLEAELKREYLARKIYQGLSNQQIDDIFKATQSSGALPVILNDAEVTFDWHGRLLQKIVKAAVQHHAKKLFTLFSFNSN